MVVLSVVPVLAVELAALKLVDPICLSVRFFYIS